MNAKQDKNLIVQIAAYYPPHIGGLEVVVREISKELAQKGYPVRVLTSTVGAAGQPRRERGLNYEVRRLRSIEFAHTPIMWSLLLQLLFLPKKSILHVHVAHAGITEIAFLVAKLRGFPIVGHFHLDVGQSGPLGVLLPIYKKYILGPALSRMDRIIVFSEEQRLLVQEKYGIKKDRISIIPNGVGKEFFADAPRSAVQAPLRLLYLGRLAIQKRVDRIIEAMSLIKAPVHLTIVGDGEDRQKLESLARDLQLTNISFEGKKYGEELRAYYKNADVFLIPSDKEGMPLVVLEAMAAGLPIVGSDVLGIRELVGGVGELVANPSGETFAAAVDALAANPERLAQLSRQSLETAKRYSWDRLVIQLEEIYREVRHE